MTNIDELRRVVREMYERARAAGYDLAGKSSEGCVSVHYPSIYEDQDRVMVEVYSYNFGPSRSHCFFFAPKHKTVNYYTWEDPDPVGCAIRVITTEWAPDLFPEYHHPAEK